METDNKFQPFLGNADFLKILSPLKTRRIIKDKHVRVRPPQKVESEDINFTENMMVSVEPLIKNKEIVGFVHRCSCGKVTEIQLEYETAPESQSKNSS